jgi:hypothetical protein
VCGLRAQRVAQSGLGHDQQISDLPGLVVVVEHGRAQRPDVGQIIGIRRTEQEVGHCATTNHRRSDQRWRRVAEVNESTWQAEYVAVWQRRPWVLLIGIAAVACIVVSIVQTFMVGPLAILFIPGLALLYVQHLIVKRSANR